MMNIKDKFLKEADYCKNCESQCYNTPDLIEECELYNNWLNKEFRKVTEDNSEHRVKFVQI